MPTMWQRDLPIFERIGNNRLLSQALADPGLRELYLQTIERCAASALENGWLEAQVTRLSALVASAAPFDTRLPYTSDDHDIEVSHVLDFARLRSGFVRDQIELARRSSSARR